jgi:peroxiredoxin
VRLREQIEALQLLPLFISADPPPRNAELRERLSVPAEWPFLSDEEHRAADLYGIPISRALAKAHGYADGYIQPAVFVFRGEEELFTFVQRPSMLNLWGAARRPEPEQVLAAVRPSLATA